MSSLRSKDARTDAAECFFFNGLLLDSARRFWSHATVTILRDNDAWWFIKLLMPVISILIIMVAILKTVRWFAIIKNRVGKCKIIFAMTMNAKIVKLVDYSTCNSVSEFRFNHLWLVKSNALFHNFRVLFPCFIVASERLAAIMTVELYETCVYAWNKRTGGTRKRLFSNCLGHVYDLFLNESRFSFALVPFA